MLVSVASALLTGASLARASSTPRCLNSSERDATLFHVPLTLHVSLSLSGLALVDSSVQRASQMAGKPTAKRRRDTNEEVENSIVSYVADVGIGSPPQTARLIVDTGSSNTWADNAVASSSSNTGNTVSVTYGSGSFSGEEYIDTVTLGDLVVPNQGVGHATATQGIPEELNGILGLGPTALTTGTLSPDSGSEIPTVIDNAYAQGSIPAPVLGVFFQPTSLVNAASAGTLTYGGVDEGMITGPVVYAPVTSTFPSGSYWGVDASLVLGDPKSGLKLGSMSGIVDTGSTLVLLATDLFTKYAYLTGAKMDDNVGLLCIPAASIWAIPDLVFKIGEQDVIWTRQAQLVPREVYSSFGASPTSECLYPWIADLGNPSGEGFDFILGQKLLERWYTVYDPANREIGFAPTMHTYALDP